MRIIQALAAAALLAAPAAAQKVGGRTSTPDQVLGQEAALDPIAESEQIAAAASAHPLGSEQNPVRVGGPEGARAYIARLRCADGTAPQVGPRSTGGVGPYGSVTERYQVDCAGRPRVALAFDLYHAEHVETRAPAGFTVPTR
ncbi:MAG TPA: hypothetical protein VFR28_05115 [Allosphingosinicella sp.]|nr:hypothetical protein [Allosphingosinicella sp.]